MSKKNKKSFSTNGSTNQTACYFELRKINPLTENQNKTFDSYQQGYNLVLHGYAGTGKTYISLYLALKQLLTNSNLCSKIIIVRSVVPSRDMGFLPGSIKEKTRIFEEPYKEICNDLLLSLRGDGYDILKMKKLVDFTTTSYLRGITFNNAIVIVDEAQNMCFQEIDTVITRIGNNSRIIFCGDFRQSDLHKYEREGIKNFMEIVSNISVFRHIEFTKDDIVRSALVKEYLIQKTEKGL